MNKNYTFNFLKYIAFTVFVFAVAISCVQEIEPFAENEISNLVISGNITTQEKVHEVVIYRTDGSSIDRDIIEDAQVWIVDNVGTIEELDYWERGIYVTSQFKGEIGRSYHVEAILSNGDHYSSDPDIITEAPPVGELGYYKDEDDLIFNMDLLDPNEDNYYRWRFRGTYQIQVPMPTADSIETCWITDLDRQFLKIENDALFNGREVLDFEVATVELGLPFNYGYYFTLEQNSLSEGAYNYWDAIKSQLENTGSILEGANYQIRGNFHNLSNPDEIVLGYFSASDVKEASIFVPDFIETFDPIPCPIIVTGPPIYCQDCRVVSANATTKKPDFWPL